MTMEEFPGRRKMAAPDKQCGPADEGLEHPGPGAASVFEEPTARHSDPETSHEAAAFAKFKASPHRLACLNALMRGPMTDFELATITGLQQTSIGKRRLECQRAGFVAQAYWALPGNEGPIKKRTPSGAFALVWQITPAGIEYLKGLA